MARSRNIKPGFAKNEFLADRSFEARLLFALLPTIADREGRLEDRPRKIKGELFPFEQVDVDAMLYELAACDDPEQDHPFIVRYQVDGIRYIQIVKFRENQNPHKDEKASEIPPCDQGASTVQAPCEHDATLVPCTAQEPDTRLKESGIRNQESEHQESEQAPSSGQTLPFEQWWQIVHLKKGKEGARKAHQKAVARLRNEHADPHAFLLDRMKLFASSPESKPTDREPIHPARWLNDGRYDDDPATWNRTLQRAGSYDRDAVLSEADRKIKEALNGSR